MIKIKCVSKAEKEEVAALRESEIVAMETRLGVRAKDLCSAVWRADNGTGIMNDKEVLKNRKRALKGKMRLSDYFHSISNRHYLVEPGTDKEAV